MAQAYPITGLEGTGTHPRLEIGDLEKNKIQFSLFIRALNNILDMKSEDTNSPNYFKKPNSWWELGAIHGRPYEPWTGDPNGPQKPADPNSWGGYCYHAAVLFPTWHRVQVLLVEQAVVLEAIEIASKLPDSLQDKQTWVKAAKTLRFPYWDWTSEQTATEGIPKIFQVAKIKIVHPGGSNEDEVRNPLNHYQYPENHRPGDSDQGAWPRTYRWVDFDTTPPTEDYDAPRALFSGNDENRSVRGLRAKIAALFNLPIDVQADYHPNFWGRFSNTGSHQGAAKVYIPPEYEPLAVSIEEPHNAIHLNIGGNGTMASTSYAGFDPIFFLHHCNVDRIYAFWEFVYPNYWIGDKGWKNENGQSVPFKTNGTFSQSPGSVVKADTSLVPFRNKSSNYWISEDVRGLLSASTTQKYYTYPGITDVKRKVIVKIDPAAGTHSAANREKFRQALYNEWKSDLATDVAVVQTVLKDSRRSQLHNPLKLLLEESGQRSKLRNFIILGDVPEFAFPGSYRLELYLVPSDGRGRIVVLDTISVFGREDPNECAACRERRAAGSHVRGHIFLFPDDIISLVREWFSKNPEDRRPRELPEGPGQALGWLAELIKWSFGFRIVTPDGKILANADPRPGVDAQREALEQEKLPKLALHSHRISFQSNFDTVEADHVSIHYDDAEEHGGFELTDKWKKV